MTTAFVIKCTCGECGPDYLHRAERPEQPYVAFPLLGVFDLHHMDPVTFATLEEAYAVLAACVVADRGTKGSTKSRFQVEPWELPEGHTAGRLVGR
jgi:hypothetical protein